MYLIFNLILLFSGFLCANTVDLTIVGSIKFAESIGGIAGGFIDCLKDDLEINCISTAPINLTDLPKDIAKIGQQKDNRIGNVAILTDMLWNVSCTPSDLMPNSKIKFAYTMLESNAIPQQWVKILNQKFDAAIVPDENIKVIYEKSGVKIPVFVLPHAIYLEEFLAKPIKLKQNKIFTFGMTAGFWERKNFELVLEAFIQEFGNKQNTQLRLHGRAWGENIEKKLKSKIVEKKIKNIEIIQKSFNRHDYLNFMTSIDCHIMLSKGEGYSIVPRESLALGIPCIVSNNSAQKTICKTGFVCSVESNIKERAFYYPFNSFCGTHFNCKLSDARNAMRQVYQNYNIYLEKAHKGREWVKQYLPKSLKAKYLSLIKPKKIILGDKNIIEDSCLITNSKSLYNKYLEILGD